MSSLYEKVNAIFANTSWREATRGKGSDNDKNEQEDRLQGFLCENCKGCESVLLVCSFHIETDFRAD